MEKIKKLNLITGIVFAGFILAVIYHYILGTIFHLGYPYNTFLFATPLVDFIYNYYPLFPEPIFNPYIQFHNFVNYFPFGMLVLFFFRLIPFALSLLLFYFINVTFFVFYNYKNVKEDLPPKYLFNIIFCSFVMSFLTYPFLLMAQVGHTDLFIFIFFALSVHFFTKEKYMKSALILSIPLAMKGFALILFPLFLMKKKFKEVFYCLLSAFSLNMISLILAKGDIFTNLSWFLSKHMPFFSKEYIIGNSGYVCSTTLFSTVKLIIAWLNGGIKPFFTHLSGVPFDFNFFVYLGNNYNSVSKALGIYLPIVALLTIAIILYTVFIEKQFWKKVLLLFICSIILPPHAADGKLLSLFIPLWLFVNSEKKSKTDIIYAVFFGLILIPKNYFQFVVPYNIMHFNISIILNPFILLLMAIIIIAEGFYLHKKGVKSGES